MKNNRILKYILIFFIEKNIHICELLFISYFKFIIVPNIIFNTQFTHQLLKVIKKNNSEIIRNNSEKCKIYKVRLLEDFKLQTNHNIIVN